MASEGIWAAKGFWQDEHTFVTYQQIVGQAERTVSKISYTGDRLTITTQSQLYGQSVVITGTLEK
jgi:hypothetical protein